jgi:hypothetical protein
VTLQITTRFLLPDGTIDVTQSAMDPGADRAPRAADIKLTRGYLLNVVVRVQSGGVVNGQCFATVSIVRGDNATIVVGQLLGGYVTTFQMLGWPGSPITSPTDGLGYLTGGSDFAPPQTGQYAVSVPTGARWRLTTVGYTIQAGASVGTRFGNLVIALPGSILVWYHNQQATATAGNGVQWVWARGAADNAGLAGSGSGSGPLPEECDLVAGSFFRTVAVGFLAGDTVLSAFWCVREWLEAA